MGYGVIGGCGLGLGYVSPVSTLIRWFPDRRGMAAGMAIMGFGGGAMIGAPLKRFFIRLFYEEPQYLGAVDQVSLVTEGGRRFAEVAGQLREVVVVGANDVGGMIVRGAEGVYVVGTGNVGVAETFITLGLIYFVVMLAAAFSYRLPAPGWTPAGWTPPDAAHRSEAHDQRAQRAHRRSAEDPPVLSALDRALLQRHGRHRRAGRGADDDDRDLRHDAAGHRRQQLRRDLRRA